MMCREASCPRLASRFVIILVATGNWQLATGDDNDNGNGIFYHGKHGKHGR